MKLSTYYLRDELRGIEERLAKDLDADPASVAGGPLSSLIPSLGAGSAPNDDDDVDEDGVKQDEMADLAHRAGNGNIQPALKQPPTGKVFAPEAATTPSRTVLMQGQVPAPTQKISASLTPGKPSRKISAPVPGPTRGGAHPTLAEPVPEG